MLVKVEISTWKTRNNHPNGYTKSQQAWLWVCAWEETLKKAVSMHLEQWNTSGKPIFWATLTVHSLNFIELAQRALCNANPSQHTSNLQAILWILFRKIICGSERKIKKTKRQKRVIKTRESSKTNTMPLTSSFKITMLLRLASMPLWIPFFFLWVLHLQNWDKPNQKFVRWTRIFQHSNNVQGWISSLNRAEPSEHCCLTKKFSRDKKKIHIYVLARVRTPTPAQVFRVA